jgi:dynein heavy chain
MHASPYIAPLEPVLQAWEEQLVGIQDTMDVWMKVQNTWLYLEPIFSSEDIQRQMASDAAKFSHVDTMWRSLMSGATNEPRVLVAASRPGLLDELREAFGILEDIQKGLHDYLEKKRLFFSRFYFLSNDELLEILSKTKEPERIQPHLRKCFDGIGRLMFNSNQEIEAMVSDGNDKEREIVRFKEAIVPARSKVLTRRPRWENNVITKTNI